MEYPFWVNDFDRVKDHKIKFPQVSKIFEYPVAFWYGERSGKKTMDNLSERLSRLLHRAHPCLPVLVLYNLPNRDVGQYSKGGALSRERYLEFVHMFAEGIGDSAPIIIYEPDGIPHAAQLPPNEAESRLELMQEAVDILTVQSHSIVYVDIGHSNWLPPDVATKLLKTVICGSTARGYSINVSNFRTVSESCRFAAEVMEDLPPEYCNYVVDTSRNGNGPFGNEWCNPPGRALGVTPTTETNISGCDAFLWVKIPGESDGKGNRGPRAGRFWPEYATELVHNSRFVK